MNKEQIEKQIRVTETMLALLTSSKYRYERNLVDCDKAINKYTIQYDELIEQLSIINKRSNK